MKFLPRSHYRVGRSRTGLGLFAVKPIAKGTKIIRYKGPKLPTKIADEYENKYMYEINARWSVDGSGRSNTARYANHSCRPNAESDTIGHVIVIRAIKAIQPGDEITYDYGKDYFKAFIKPIGCLCVKCIAKRKAERAAARLKAKRAKVRKAKRDEKLAEAARLAAKRKKARAKAATEAASLKASKVARSSEKTAAATPVERVDEMSLRRAA